MPQKKAPNRATNKIAKATSRFFLFFLPRTAALAPFSDIILLCAVYDLSNPRFCSDFRAGEIIIGENAHEFLGGVISDEVDGCAAESATSEAGAEAAFCLPGDIDERVEFRCAVLEEVARTGVALKKILPELFDIPLAEGALSKNDALIFTDNMIRALIFT